ncbi:MAG: DsbA family protein [Acidobacteriota bacterium]|nr:DsbA family protein [Acidobacteriota bacterium]MDH3529203.1 DsbA family protein [Acidobacteriota bacterium]
MTQADKKAASKSSRGPFLIIGAIALATILGIYFVSQSGDVPDPLSANSNANSTQTGDLARERYAKAPNGASPANMLGSENASIVLEEFADFQCPTCSVVHPKVKEVISLYGPKIKFVFRNYPLTQIHPNAYDAALAAEAAGAQGKFWQMQDLIFKNQPTWAAQPNARPTFIEYAKSIGLDAQQFENDALSMGMKSRIDADVARGRALNVTSTPTILINGKPIPFQQLEVASMKQLIDAELERINGPQKPDSGENTSAGDQANSK